jgi:hypothetical protein
MTKIWVLARHLPRGAAHRLPHEAVKRSAAFCPAIHKVLGYNNILQAGRTAMQLAHSSSAKSAAV